MFKKAILVTMGIIVAAFLILALYSYMYVALIGLRILSWNDTLRLPWLWFITLVEYFLSFLVLLLTLIKNAFGIIV